MYKLMKLEYSRFPFRTYWLAALGTACSLLALLYLFAFIPRLEPGDANMALFTQYQNLVPMFGLLTMVVFGVFTAVLYSKLVIEDYAGQRLTLLFSYPVSRSKILVAKLLLISLFVMIVLIASSLMIYAFFGLTEQFWPLMDSAFTGAIFLQALLTAMVMALAAASVGAAAAAIGWSGKSVPTTIIASVLIASLFSNVVVSSSFSPVGLAITAVLLVSLGIVSAVVLLRKVKTLEVS